MTLSEINQDTIRIHGRIADFQIAIATLNNRLTRPALPPQKTGSVRDAAAHTPAAVASL